ncbi:MAG: hypothetical protein R3E79_57995 [Caldilineaceae bacterium]
MIWTYRIFRDKNGRYSIREVFYECDGRLLNYSKNPVAPIGASLEDLMQLVQWFREAFDSPVLSLEAVEAELATQPTQAKKPLTDRSQTLSFQQVLAQLTEEADEETEIDGESVLV